MKNLNGDFYIFTTYQPINGTPYPSKSMYIVTNAGVVLFEGEKILYGGCLVKSTESKELGNIKDANVDQWGQSINNIMRKYPTPKYIIPGHLGWTDPEALKHTLALLERMEIMQNK